MQVASSPRTHDHHSDYPNLHRYLQQFGTEEAKPLLHKLWKRLFGKEGRGGSFSLLPCFIIWRTLMVVHAGPAMGQGEEAATHSSQGGPQDASELVSKDIFGHLWMDPADSAEVVAGGVLVGSNIATDV
jgi:hypothetical protein